jgi:hypothetical protein
MAASILTPLQITASAALLNNQGLKPLPSALATALAAFNATPLITAYQAAVAYYLAQTYKTTSTLTALLSLGSTTCPALGNSIPAGALGDFVNLVYPTATTGSVVVQNLPTSPYGFSGLVEQTGDAYLGDGDAGRFAQGFLTVQGFISVTNDYINSAVNANTYLGPTFTNMDALVTADISTVNPDIENFGVDLEKQGQLANLANLNLYGTPAGLIQQISARAGITDAAIPVLQQALTNAGLSRTDIRDLVQNNVQSLLNPSGLSANQFDRLQKIAWLAMTAVGADELTQILSILEVTTPNIVALSDLLDPVKVFPLSYATLQTPSPDGPVPIFNSTGAVNSDIQPIVNSYLPTQSGCDELGKIIPQADAVANKAIQVALQQIPGIADSSLPALAETARGYTDQSWDPAQPYLVNDLVANGETVPEFYRAQQDVPIGIDIGNTSYWSPTTLDGLSTMAGLPLVQDLATPVPAAVTSFFANNIATGTGPEGTITTCDVLGTAIDYNNIAAQFTAATAVINQLYDDSSSLVTLEDAYDNILLASNDAGVLTQIANANAAIQTIVDDPVYATQVAALNTAFVTIAQSISDEKALQTRAGINYFDLLPGEQTSIMAFVQNLTGYAQLTADCEAAEFLEQIADTSMVGGQALIGAMREARNKQYIQESNMFMFNNVPLDPPLVPIPVVVPVQ